ncbi:MAG TPA: hypothetical protein VNO30_29775 [Kofleriaceae bacterium]|nr:hypothetical protein [Kofleriaceae bacterium]
MIATAPGKLILTGEYAVLDGAPALVMAVDRRAVARRTTGASTASSPFLEAVAAELAARRGAADPAARAARELAVDSSAFYDGDAKLGLGSSAAVTAAATACALAEAGPLDRAEILAVAQAAHAAAQGLRGARGSGADVAAAVHGGLILYEMSGDPAAPPRISALGWPASLLLVPFFTGRSADTPQLVAQVAAARAARPAAVDAALAEIAAASRAVCDALAALGASADAPAGAPAGAAIAAFARAGRAIAALAAAAEADLVPDCVTAAADALAPLGGTVKTTGAGGGDLAVGVVPIIVDRTRVTRTLIQAGCRPLNLSLDETGVDTRPDAG